MAANNELETKLQTLVDELKQVMANRKARIEELRAEIEEIENANQALENTISDLLKSF